MPTRAPTAPATPPPADPGPDSTPAPPPALERFDAEDFRRTLAGLARPGAALDPTSRISLRDEAARFGARLPLHFGRRKKLKRMTLWGRIASAFEAAVAAVAVDDAEGFLDAVLEHVGADPGRAAADDYLSTLRELVATRGAESGGSEWRAAFIDQFRGARLYTAVALARKGWEEYKALNPSAAAIEAADDGDEDDDENLDDGEDDL